MNVPGSKKALAILMLAVAMNASTQPVLAVSDSQPNTVGTVTAAAVRSDIRIIANGKELSFPDAAPYIDSGRTMVPVRFVSEALGAHVEWNAAEQKVTITHQGKTIELTVGQKTAMVNGTKLTLDAKPVVIKGRTFVPLRFVSEAFGADVQWNAPERLVTVKTARTEDTSVQNPNTPEKKPEAGEPLTIKQAVQLALESNNDLRAVRLDAKTADINARMVNAKVKEIPAEMIESLEMAQQKYVNNAKAQMAKKVNELYLKAAESKTVLATQKAYYDVLNAEADVRLKEQSLKRSEAQVKVAEASFRVGTRAKTDVLQAQAALSGAKAALAASRNNLNIARMKLNDMMGIDINKQWSLSQEDLTTSGLSIDLDKAISLAVQQRAEVLQKQEELKVAELNLELISKYSALSTYQGSISKNDVEKAKIALEDAKKAVSVEVAQAYYNLRAAEEAVDANRKALEAARENYRLTNLRFENGLGTTLEVIQAEEELSDRENKYQTAIYTYNIGVVNFENAIGKPL
ncbi:stalk domain-containing protein [Brevibacillus sp. H7]|uniref:stalk domain-containing protein n=1 Tax=Brevibacillus sp. H7 TaxID=3349138 RepID=UPI00382CF188